MINVSGQLAQGAANQLNQNRQMLNQSIERLSSGLRINSAKDDAAGQAIGNRMTAQVRGGQQAVRNANDGISMAQTAEGALSEINDRLQRIRELTVQGLSETNSGTAGDYIQAEINLNLKEIDRLNKQTEFNNTTLLDGSAGSKKIQVGANDGDTLEMNFGAPGFSVRELGLERMTIQGEPGNMTPINTLSGSSNSARNIPLDADNTTVSYSPPAGDPNLVEITNADINIRDMIQLGGEGGRIRENSITATHDTDSLENSVNISVRDPVLGATARESLARSQQVYQNADGDALPGNHRGVVQSNNQYWIETSNGGVLEYRRAEVTFDNRANRLTAKALDETATPASEMGNIGSPIQYAPGVQKTDSN